MKIKLHLLRQAQALTAHGSFSRAAAALNLSQPALSQGIRELEEQVGLQLFVRSRSGPELTDFGRLFMQHAEELDDAAFKWLEKAYAERDGGLAFLKADPYLKRLSGDPRFSSLLKRIGFSSTSSDP